VLNLTPGRSARSPTRPTARSSASPTRPCRMTRGTICLKPRHRDRGRARLPGPRRIHQHRRGPDARRRQREHHPGPGPERPGPDGHERGHGGGYADRPRLGQRADASGNAQSVPPQDTVFTQAKVGDLVVSFPAGDTYVSSPPQHAWPGPGPAPQYAQPAGPRHSPTGQYWPRWTLHSKAARYCKPNEEWPFSGELAFCVAVTSRAISGSRRKGRGLMRTGARGRELVY
jgi:hypothetical protein